MNRDLRRHSHFVNLLKLFLTCFYHSSNLIIMPRSRNYRQWKNAAHVVFWLASIAFALLVFDIVSEHQLRPNASLILKAIILNAGFALAVYTNFYLLIPRFLKKQSYIYYLFWLLLSLSMSSLMVTGLLSLIENRDLSRQLFSTNFFTTATYVIITSMAKLLSDWIELQDIELRWHKAEGQRLEAELKTLKAQINPHFLFNSLNNIYSLALTNSPKTPETILKLSDLMRHVLYESRENFIPIKKEVEFVMNFIDLQRIRLSEQVDIQFVLQGAIPDRKIMPLAFEPFIDNAFKHGPRTSTDDIFIWIKLEMHADEVLFEIANSSCWTEQKKATGAHGIGLENVRQRLALLYAPNEYELETNRDKKSYRVTLKLQLK